MTTLAICPAPIETFVLFFLVKMIQTDKAGIIFFSRLRDVKKIAVNNSAFRSYNAAPPWPKHSLSKIN